jgi:hypothetical protein
MRLKIQCDGERVKNFYFSLDLNKAEVDRGLEGNILEMRCLMPRSTHLGLGPLPLRFLFGATDSRHEECETGWFIYPTATGCVWFGKHLMMDLTISDSAVHGFTS